MRIPGTKILAVICAVTGIISILFVYLFSKSLTEGFPYIAPGTYLGEIDGLESNSDDKPQRIVIEKATSGDELVVAISGTDSFSQIVDNSKIGGAALGSDLLAPVILSHKQVQYQLSGKLDKAGYYSGKINDLTNGKSGEWSVSLVNEYPAIRNSKDLEIIREFLALRNDLNETDTRINVAEISVAQQKAEIERLTHFITEGESLKRNAEEKLKETKTELERAKEEFASKQKEVKSLNEKLELSQRLTPMGRLVSLARESLDRERRWAESMNKTSLSDEASDFDNVVGRGERILLLKNEIQLENERINRLSSSTNGSKLNNSTNKPDTDEVLD